MCVAISYIYVQRPQAMVALVTIFPQTIRKFCTIMQNLTSQGERHEYFAVSSTTEENITSS